MGVPWIQESFPSVDVLIVCVWVEGAGGQNVGSLDRRCPESGCAGHSFQCPPPVPEKGCSRSSPGFRPERLRLGV